MNETKRVLIVEDVPADAELTEREVQRVLPGSEFLRVETREDYLAALESFGPDLILSDFKLPQFDGMTALTLARQRMPDTPFIILTGSMNEDTAVECMKAGAWDYVIKEHVKRLGPAVLAALEQKTLRDERERADEAILRLRHIFHYAAWGVVITDPQTNAIIAVNPAFARMHGYAVEEMAGMNVAETLTPESRAALPAHIRITDHEGHHSFESARLRKDGSRFPCWIDVTVFRDESGRVLFRAANITDITDRKRADQTLRESEERSRILFEQAADIILQLEVTPEGIPVIREANSATFRLLGYERDELIGHPVSFIEAAPDVSKAIAERRQNALLGMGTVFETRHRCKDGTTLDFECSVTEMQIGSKTVAISVERDITGRKVAEEALRQSEERYRNLFEFLNDAALLADVETGRILDANLQAEALLGRPRSEIVGMHQTEIHPPGKMEEYREHFGLHVRKGREVDYDGEVARKDGTIVPVMISASTFTVGGQLLILGLFRDLTERRRLEAQFQQAQKMESVGRLAGGVAHDFNNMLSVILGNAELALEEIGPSGQLRSDIEEIRKAAYRSADLTRQLLAFARRQTVVPKVLDLNDLLTGMVKMLRRMIGEDIDLVLVPRDKPWTIKVDPAQVDQIMTNLCVNARDAIAGVGKVIVETRNVTLDETYCRSHAAAVPGEYVMLAVSDNGSGMEKEVLEHAFEPFFTTKGEGQGTGLGLSTVYGIVKQNEGFIDALSEPGKGTTFMIYLPRFTGQAMGGQPEASRETPRGQGETVLIVEDETAILNLGKKMLENLGYSVLTARTPAEAVRLAETHAGAVDLLITDVVMPQMNGRDLAARIAVIKPGVKCMYMSGYTSTVIVDRGVLQEGVCFLQKPFSAHDLAVRVREALAPGRG